MDREPGLTVVIGVADDVLLGVPVLLRVRIVLHPGGNLQARKSLMKTDLVAISHKHSVIS